MTESNNLQETVNPTRVLVVAVGGEQTDQDLVRQDAGIYQQHYPQTQAFAAGSGQSLGEHLQSGSWDMVHLISTVDAEGVVGGAHIQDLMGACLQGGIKQLWIARENDPEVYLKYAQGNDLNLMMTVDRNGEHFGIFLDKLLKLMASGLPLAMAWVELVPQTELAPEHDTLPSCIVMPGAKPTVFLP